MGRVPPPIAKFQVPPVAADAEPDEVRDHVNKFVEAFNRVQDAITGALNPIRFNPILRSVQFQIIEVASSTLGNPPTFQVQYRSSGTASWTTILTIPSTLALTLATVLPIANGGTNSGTALSGNSIMISNGTQIVQGAAGTTTTVLHGNASGAPTYSAVSLTADVTGTLPVGNGGTNSASALSGHRTVVSNASAIVEAAAGTSGQLWQSAGSGSDPGWAGDTSWTAVLGGVGFQNSWVNLGGAFFPCAFFKDPCGFVHLRGAAKSGTVNSTIFTLPAGYRPTATCAFLADSFGGLGGITVDSSGNVTQFAGVNNSQFLDGAVFDTRA